MSPVAICACDRGFLHDTTSQKDQRKPSTTKWHEFHSSNGVSCQFFTARCWDYDNYANEAFRIYVRAFNLHVYAAKTGDLQNVEETLWSEFDDKARGFYAPFFEAARDEYYACCRASSEPVKQMWERRQQTIPALGFLWRYLENLVASGEVPDEAKGITMKDVIAVCYKRHPKGPFMPLVRYRRRQPHADEPRTKAKQDRHPYSDVGLAIAPEGLYLSLLSPKDSRVWVKTPNMKHGKYIDQLDFNCGKKPLVAFFSMEEFMEMDFGDVFWDALNSERIQIRTAVLDSSLVPNLPHNAQRSTVHFHRWMKVQCVSKGFDYCRKPTVGSELRSARDFLARTGPDDDSTAPATIHGGSILCPHCNAYLELHTDASYGIPTRQEETCSNCHIKWKVGLLLAEGARAHGAFMRVPEDAYGLY